MPVLIAVLFDRDWAMPSCSEESTRPDESDMRRRVLSESPRTILETN